MRLQFAVVIGELIEEDGDWKAIQDDPKGNAAKGKYPPQKSLRIYVTIAYSRDANLEREINGKLIIIILSSFTLPCVFPKPLCVYFLHRKPKERFSRWKCMETMVKHIKCIV